MDEQQIITSTTQRTGPREHVLNVMDKSRTAGDNDGIRRAKRSRKCRRNLERHHGERLAKSLAKAPRRAGMVLLQLAGELFQLGFGTKGVVVVVDRAHLLRHGLSEGFRQLRLDISDLVQLATMDHRVVEDRFHGAREGLGAVDDDEDRPCHLESAIAKPDEEVLDDGGVLGVAFCDRERVLSARQVDPHRHDTDVITEVHAVDHERHEVELREVTGQQLGESVLCGLDEAPRDRGARRGAGTGLDAFADGLEPGLVAARGELGEHLLHCEAAEHLGRGEVLIGGHQKLTSSICRTHPRAPHRDASAAQGHRALLVSMAHRRAVRVVTALRAREGGDALF